MIAALSIEYAKKMEDIRLQMCIRDRQYCMTTYGEDYAWYKARTPRYFLLK